MKHYFDTSFLVSLYLPEKDTKRVESIFQDLIGSELVASEWTRVEFAATLARKSRDNNIDIGEVQAHDIINKFEAMVENFFEVLVPKQADFDQAREWLRSFQTGLKGPDALHLAIAKNNHVEAIYSLDKKMIKAGKILDLPMSDGSYED